MEILMGKKTFLFVHLEDVYNKSYKNRAFFHRLKKAVAGTKRGSLGVQAHKKRAMIALAAALIQGGYVLPKKCLGVLTECLMVERWVVRLEEAMDRNYSFRRAQQYVWPAVKPKPPRGEGCPWPDCPDNRT